jgi:hypothetical protein
MKLKNCTRAKVRNYLLGKDLLLSKRISQILHHSWPRTQFIYSKHRVENPFILASLNTWCRVSITLKRQSFESPTQHQKEQAKSESI